MLFRIGIHVGDVLIDGTNLRRISPVVHGLAVVFCLITLRTLRPVIATAADAPFR
jgi:hypothetical protein